MKKDSRDPHKLTNEELTCVHVSMKTSREAAATRLAWTLAKVRRTLEQPHVKLYAIQYREKFISAMIKRLKVTRPVGKNIVVAPEPGPMERI